jgi:hypothetical protein
VSPAFVGKCETGDRRIDALELQRFADLYGRDIRHLISGEQEGSADTAETFG